MHEDNMAKPFSNEQQADRVLDATSGNSARPNIWIFMFFSLLTIAVVIIAYQDLRRADEPMLYYKEKYDELERQYIELAKSHSYVLETVMKNDVNLQPFWPEFATKSHEEYIEYLRRQIVAVQVNIDRLDHDHAR
jgi:hypothetical protein